MTQYGDAGSSYQSYSPLAQQYGFQGQQYNASAEQNASPWMQNLMDSNAASLPWMDQNTDPMQYSSAWDQDPNSYAQSSPNLAAAVPTTTKSFFRCFKY